MMKKGKVIGMLSLMARNWKTLLILMTFDALFILVLLALRFVQTSLDNALFPMFEGSTSLIYSAVYVVLELSLLILAYSFFKYLIIKFMQEGFREAEFEPKRFFSFLWLNCTVFIPLIIIVAIALDFVLILLNNALSKGGLDPFKFVFAVLGIGALALAFFIFAYTLINILHFSFLKEKRLKKLLKEGIIRSVKAESYKIYWSNFKIILVMGILFLIAYFFVKSFAFNDFSSYVRNIESYKAFMYWASAIVLYFLLLFNRFDLCMKKNEKI